MRQGFAGRGVKRCAQMWPLSLINNHWPWHVTTLLAARVAPGNDRRACSTATGSVVIDVEKRSTSFRTASHVQSSPNRIPPGLRSDQAAFSSSNVSSGSWALSR